MSDSCHDSGNGQQLIQTLEMTAEPAFEVPPFTYYTWRGQINEREIEITIYVKKVTE